MSNGSWRPVFYSDTDADTDGIKYISVPADREYKIISLGVTYERSSDITYTAALAPVLDIVTSTGAHGSAGGEKLLARYQSIATMVADTDANYVFWQSSIPAGDTYANVAVGTRYFYVPIPEGLILSPDLKAKVWSSPSTGGEYAVFDVYGHFGIRDSKGNRA